MGIILGTGAVWIIGFSAYLLLRKKDKENNFKYYNLAGKHRKYNKVQGAVNGKNSSIFR